MQNFTTTSWNVQGTWNITGHTSLTKVQAELQTAYADVIALQEAEHVKSALQNIYPRNTYNLFVPKSKNNHNVIASKYPIINGREIVFPNWGQKRQLENATTVNLQMHDKTLRIYNCHFPIFRAGPALRLKQLEYIFEDNNDHTGPTIICGDLNTTIPAPGMLRAIIKAWHLEPNSDMVIHNKFLKVAEQETFSQTLTQNGFTEVLSLKTPTWSPFKTEHLELFNLKLDWFMVKGLKTQHIKLGDYVSDHKLIQVTCNIVI